MSAKVCVYTLRNDATIGPLIGNARVYPVDGVLEGANRPFITYQVTGNQPEKDMAGLTIGIDGEINLQVVGDTESSVKAILDAMDAAFENLGGTTVAGVSVLAAQASDTGDEIAGPIDTDDGQAYLGNATVQIYYGG